jgi:hypothetical protein
MKALLGVLAAPMRLLARIVGAPFRYLRFCSLPGAVAGSLAGLLMAAFELSRPAGALSPQQLVIIALLITIPALLLVLFLFGLLHYGVGQILPAATLNALITTLLVVFLVHWLNMPAAAGILGLLVGVIVGALLCLFCRLGLGGYRAEA